MTLPSADELLTGVSKHAHGSVDGLEDPERKVDWRAVGAGLRSEGSVWPHRGRHTWGYTRTLGVHQKHLGVHPQEFKYCSRALVRF